MIPYMSERSRERFPYPGFDGHTLEQVRALRVRFDLGDESYEAVSRPRRATQTRKRPTMNNDERNTNMNIIEKHFYQSATLPEAPERATRAEAEADEARGVELAAYLAILPALTVKQWAASWDVARSAEWGAAWGAAWGAGRGASRDAERGAAHDAAWGASRGAGWAAQALVARDLISVEHFNTLTAPMRAAGINFDNLGRTR